MKTAASETSQRTGIRARPAVLAAAAFWLASTGTATAQAEQDATLQFARLWGDFLQFCGPALTDPDAVFTAQPRFEGYPHAQWYVTPDRAQIVIDHASQDFNRALTLVLMRGQAGFNMDCEAEFSSEGETGGWQTAALASSVRDLIQSNEDMRVVGGRLEQVPGSNWPLVQLETFNFNHFVVEGVFPDHPAARVLVELSDVGMSTILYTAWEAR